MKWRNKKWAPQCTTWQDRIRRDAYGPDRLCDAGRLRSVWEVHLCQTLEALENKTKRSNEVSLFSPACVPALVCTSEGSVWRTFVAFVRCLVRCLAQTFVKWALVLCWPTQFRGINYPVNLLWLPPLRVLPSSSRIGVKLIYLLWVLIRVPSLWSSSRVCLNIFLSVFFSFFWYKSQRSDTLL